MCAWVKKWIPPDIHDILLDALQESADWYEVRTSMSCLSFGVEEYAQAVSTARTIQKIFSSATFYYCWKQGGRINEIDGY